MPPRRFTALVQEGHKGCAVEVPFHASEVFGVEPSELVDGKVRGIPVRGALAPDVPRATAVAFESWIVFRWGKHFLLLDDELLADAGVKSGASARVQVEPRDRRPSSAGPAREPNRPRRRGVRGGSRRKKKG